MTQISRIVANGPTFAILYILAMIPTYILPYMGSNSATLSVAGAATGYGFYPLFWVHLAFLLILCVLAYCRGTLVAKVWIVILPILALIFDLVPGLNIIPLVPTVMHLIAVIVGLSSKRVDLA